MEKDIRVWDEDGDKTRTVERFAYNGQDIVLQTDRHGGVTHCYLHGPMVDQCLADERVFEDNEGNEAQSVLYLLSDNLGTVRDIVDYDPATGVTQIVNHIIYDTFGNVLSQTDSSFSTLYGYTGRETDPESDLYYYRARYYDPHLTTFISPDAISFASGDVNLYRYVGNSPTNATDPSGLDDEEVIPAVTLPRPPKMPMYLEEKTAELPDSNELVRYYRFYKMEGSSVKWLMELPQVSVQKKRPVRIRIDDADWGILLQFSTGDPIELVGPRLSDITGKFTSVKTEDVASMIEDAVKQMREDLGGAFSLFSKGASALKNQYFINASLWCSKPITYTVEYRYDLHDPAGNLGWLDKYPPEKILNALKDAGYDASLSSNRKYIWIAYPITTKVTQLPATIHATPGDKFKKWHCVAATRPVDQLTGMEKYLESAKAMHSLMPIMGGTAVDMLDILKVDERFSWIHPMLVNEE